MEEIQPKKEGLYKQISALVDNWVPDHLGEAFTSSQLSRDLEISSREGIKELNTKLCNLIKKGIAEKTISRTNTNTIYRLIDNSVIEEDWDKQSQDLFPLKFPCNHDNNDLSYFSFQNKVEIPRGSIIVLAGVTSGGKSDLLRNILLENLDHGFARYMSSETSPASFGIYLSHMKWVKPFNPDGSKRFSFISKGSNFQDAILPDALNIIDWLDPPGEAYDIGKDLKHIQDKLKGGIGVIGIQKDPNKEYGRGGISSAQLATLYLTIDSDIERSQSFRWMIIKKAKQFKGDYDPNGTKYGFNISNSGAEIANIRDIKKCLKCYGTGKVKRGGNMDTCVECNGLGWLDHWKVTHRQPNYTEPKQQELVEEVPF